MNNEFEDAIKVFSKYKHDCFKQGDTQKYSLTQYHACSIMIVLSKIS